MLLQGVAAVSIEYSDSVEEATQIARTALPLASQFSVPANPVNYAVLYEYVAGQNPELTAALDQLRKSAKDLTDEQVHSLYRDFVSDTDEQALKDVRSALSTIVDSTRGSLDKVAEESQVYQENLGDAAKQLSGGESSDVVDIVAQLIDETVRMQVTSRELQEELAQTNQDLSSLRTDFKRVREESMADPLTGIQNRRAFDASLAQLREHAAANNEALCLLMVDIDHFKKVNDTYGHVVGDAVLKRVSNAINDTVRGGDVLARYGGEEFVLLLPNTPMEGAERVADNICNNVRNQKMDSASVGKNIGRVTVSVGVALFYSSESAEQFVVRADTALYRAKESGRNRVCTHEVG
jgi:diguanylate cyclase